MAQLAIKESLDSISQDLLNIIDKFFTDSLKEEFDNYKVCNTCGGEMDNENIYCTICILQVKLKESREAAIEAYDTRHKYRRLKNNDACKKNRIRLKHREDEIMDTIFLLNQTHEKLITKIYFLNRLIPLCYKAVEDLVQSSANL